ncbi:MAG: hypothetical protein U1F51_07935 [Burkholderiales bacterium]
MSAASIALMSPAFSSGVRQFARSRRIRSAFITPRFISLIGGIRKPSWKSSWLLGEMLEGTRPPMSEQCTKLQP